MPFLLVDTFDDDNVAAAVVVAFAFAHVVAVIVDLLYRSIPAGVSSIELLTKPKIY